MKSRRIIVPVSAVTAPFRGPKFLNARFSPLIAFDCCAY
jgi:hypothetical protein